MEGKLHFFWGELMELYRMTRIQPLHSKSFVVFCMRGHNVVVVESQLGKWDIKYRVPRDMASEYE